LATGLSLLVPITLSTMAIVLLAPILPLLMIQFGAVPGHEYWVPMILTIPALCVALLSPIAGALGDRVGRRRLLLWSLFVYGFVGLAPLYLTSLTAILLSRVGVGITEALIMTLSTTMIADHFEGESRNRWLAGQTAMASVSALIFFNVGGQLGGLGWRAPFWVYGSAFAMLIAVMLFTWEKQEDGDARRSDATLSWADFPWARMGGIVAVTIFGSVLFYTVQIQAAPGLVAHGMADPGRIGFYTSIASIGVPLGTFIFSRLSRLPVRILLFAEFLILATGFILMSHGTTVGAFLGGCALNQIGAGMLLPTLLVWAVDGLAFDLRARGTGLWTAAFSLGQWLSPIAITTIGRSAGGLLPSFQYLGFAALAAAGCALVWRAGGAARPHAVQQA
jgi:MFS family permease